MCLQESLCKFYCNDAMTKSLSVKLTIMVAQLTTNDLVRYVKPNDLYVWDSQLGTPAQTPRRWQRFNIINHLLFYKKTGRVLKQVQPVQLIQMQHNQPHENYLSVIKLEVTNMY